MNLWIETARDSLFEAISEVDCVIVNDAEIRELTGESNLARAARAVMERGPRSVVAKQGEYGAALFTADSFFALPGFPLEDVRDPTGAGDSFAGGFLGYLDSHGGELDEAGLRRAMGYGTVLASFNVEEFGAERVARLTPRGDRPALRRAGVDDPLRAAAGRRRVAAILTDVRRTQARGGVMATEQQMRDAAADGGAAPGSDTLTVTDNRTGRTYELPITDGTVRAMDLRQIKVSEDEFGMLAYDPAFTNTAACRSAITYIDGEAGILEHRGYSIEQLCERSSFLEVAYLLIFGELPTGPQLDRWTYDITHHTFVHEDLKHFFEGFRYDAHPMGMLLAGVGALSTFYPDAKQIDDPEERYMAAVRLIAKVPTLAAFSYRHNMGLPYVYPENDLNFAENFLSMMFKKTEMKHEPNPSLSRALDVLFILHADHEQNCSTNAVRGVGSSGVDPYSAVAAGVAALYGPLHGGANEAVLRMLRRIESVENIPDFLERVKKREEKLMGFGHRVYKNYDPRARIIQQHMEEVFEATEYNRLVEIARELEKRALDDEYFTSRKLYPNVDYYSGIIYEALEIPTEMFTVIFAIPRTAGWVAQWMEMNDDSEQKIARPRQIYTGHREREYVQVADSGGAGENRRAAGAPAETASTRRVAPHASGPVIAPLEPVFASLTILVPLRGKEHPAVPASRGSREATPDPHVRTQTFRR